MAQKIVGKNIDLVHKVSNLGLNQTLFLNGEAYIGISPFDSYFMFNIFHEVDGQDTYLDLSQSGNLYLNFFNDNEEIKILNLSNISGIDSKLGQVVFKISKVNAKKILGFKSNTFYISSLKQNADQSSDESVLYTGKFFPYEQLPENVLRSENNKLKSNITSITNDLNSKIDSLTTENDNLNQTIANLTASLKAQQDINTKLNDQNDLLKQKVDADTIKKVDSIISKSTLEEEHSQSIKILNNIKELKNKDVQVDTSIKEYEKVLELNNSKNIFSFQSKDNTKNQSLKSSDILSNSSDLSISSLRNKTKMNL